MNYTIISAWYNVREKENHELKNDNDMKHFCTPEYYYKCLKLLLEKEFPIIIFTEPSCEKKIWDLRPLHLHNLTRVIIKDYDELSMYCYFEKYCLNHLKSPIPNLDPLKFTPLYKFLVLQKTEFLKEGAMANPFSTKQFAWMDTRLHSVYNMDINETNNIFESIDPNRILIHQMAYTTKEEIEDKNNFYQYTRGKIAAGFFGGYFDKVIEFANLCKQEIISSINQNLALTDEMVYAYVVGKNPNLFNPYFGDYSEMLKNVLYVKNNAHLPVLFMYTSFNCGNHYYTSKVCDALTKGLIENFFNLSLNDTFNVWYNNYVANYWLNNKQKCKNIINELYDMCLINNDMKSYIDSKYNFFITNISYLNDEELTQKFKTLFLK